MAKAEEDRLKSVEKTPFVFWRFLLFSGLLVGAFVALVTTLYLWLPRPLVAGFVSNELPSSGGEEIVALDRLVKAQWASAGVEPAPEVDVYTLARRLSLGLTGAVPSLEELRRLEKTAEIDQLDAWLDHLFADERYAHYLAERLARVYVGVETGPFLVYRRRRMVDWLAEQLAANRPYDAMARDIIAAKGIWTTEPAANFITVTATDGGGKGSPDEIKLAARTSRAFLGMNLDCMQCHDDKFGDRWKQTDFHQLAAFFVESDISLAGVQDDPSLTYETRLRGSREAEPVAMQVPYQAELMTDDGSARDRLASWITHEENRAFSRAIANRAWAILFGRPLVEPIDDIPIDAPVPAVLDYLADHLVAEGYDLQSLFRLIAHSAAFQRASQSGDPDLPVTVEQEQVWAAFPLTQLRPEQVSGSVIQAASVQAIDASSHILQRIMRWGGTNDFIKRYGDKGEQEYTESTGTIPQRLILMNGKLVDEKSEENPLVSASTRIATLAENPEVAVEAAFLATLTRLPTQREAAVFGEAFEKCRKPKDRVKALADLYWALMNSTEFSWNR